MKFRSRSARALVGPLILAAGLVLVAQGASAQALDDLTMSVRGDHEALKDELKAASLLFSARTDERTGVQDVLAAASGEYARLVQVLYANGYYSGTVSVLIDGREASGLSTFARINAIEQVRVRIDPGPQFLFDTARIGPLAPGTEKIDSYRRGEPARASAVQDALDAAVGDWRDDGHAKVAVASQSARADHRTSQLDSEIALDPGPEVRLGDLVIMSESNVRRSAIRRIAGYPQGEVYDPEELDAVVQSLRETGAFSTVSLTEAEALGPGNTLPMELVVADQRPRRIGAGAEISSSTGLTLSGYWMHRNIFGGAERLRLDAEVARIADPISGPDYSLSARLDVPAVIGSKTWGYAQTSLEYANEAIYDLYVGELEFGLSRTFTPELSGSIGVNYSYAVIDFMGMQGNYSIFSLPGELTWDMRDDALDPKSGVYVSTELRPFQELGGPTGLRAYADARGYVSFGGDDQVTLATRLQAGSIIGPSAYQTYPDYLFHSGGSGTVRGQPYDSLGYNVGTGSIGGRAFMGGSAELRYSVTDRIGVVGFFDIGHIGGETFFDGNGGWHSGAGLGVRYATGVGPIRADIALPVGGDTGQGIQLYIGLGQAF